MKKLLTFIFILLFSATAHAQQNFITIKKGDTIYGLSKRYSISMRTILEMNNLQYPYKISIGQKLILPDFTYHTVKKGDSLYQIAKKYDVSLTQVKRINALRHDNIKVGQRLIVPSKEVIAKKENRIKKAKKRNNKIKKNGRYLITQKPAKSSFQQSFAYFLEKQNFNGRFLWPVKGSVITKFGKDKDGNKNHGISISAPEGKSVNAAADGQVVYIGKNVKGYGNLVIIRHGRDWLSAYAHQDKIFVNEGEYIFKGQKLGAVGKTGNVKTPRLHFAIRKRQKSVDPLSLLPKG